jgi:hypothetical protein
VSSVSRIYPEAKTALIDWVEKNFHEIDSYIATFTLKDGTTMIIHDCHSVMEAFGIIGLTEASLTHDANEGIFIAKPKGDNHE